MPIWAGLSYAIGHLLLSGHWVLADMQRWTAHWWEPNQWSLNWVFPFLLGNLLVASAMTAIGYFGARTLLYCVRNELTPLAMPAKTADASLQTDCS
jgi:uncharacterized protein (DUF2062 family)